ncbi:putative O-glycosylation ligase, exosortase A system-associated [Salinisphaera sp.]|uniref:putative O-glycosylation ligase, exosortase A system-associated n=1 Tax=Salinisphaera sp. TaxID=1914330 RepID=UPI002D7A2F14|nr:putative O-glycosylation ligase, exosortase A system-associated [Salinisphaera sp.]HET7313718.1 putative O-glycosylation ligase, exosortase A system-associated [Salinisphaera sp.]
MRDLALLLFVVATLPMAFVRPIIGLLLWMMFSYLNPHRMTWGFAASFPWVMIVALATLIALAIQPRQRQMPPVKPLVVLMTLFLIWTALSTSHAVLSDLAFQRFMQFVKMMTMTYVTLMLVTDREKLQWVIWVIVASFGFWGVKGGVFTLLTGGSYHVMGPGSSFFTDNNAFALIMCMTIPLMRHVQLRATQRWMHNLLWVVMGFTALSVIGTYSRGGMLALAITVGMLLIKSRRRGLLILLVPAAALAIAAVMPAKYTARIETINNYHHDASAQGRIQSWKFATHVAKANPLLGGGFDVWASDRMWQQYGPIGATPGRAIHSIFFEVLGEQGFVGLGLYVALLLVGYMSLARVRKRARAQPGIGDLADLASMIQVSLIAYAAAGALLPLAYIDFFYQLLAVTVVIQVLAQREISAADRRATNKKAPAAAADSHASGHAPAGSRGKRRRPRKLSARPNGGIKGAQDLPPW